MLTNIPVGAAECSERTGCAHNVALATLPNFTLPGDVSGSKRYWKRELLTEEIVATPHGTIRSNDRPGFGYDIDMEFLDSITVRQDDSLSDGK